MVLKIVIVKEKHCTFEYYWMLFLGFFFRRRPIAFRAMCVCMYDFHLVANQGMNVLRGQTNTSLNEWSRIHIAEDKAVAQNRDTNKCCLIYQGVYTNRVARKGGYIWHWPLDIKVKNKRAQDSTPSFLDISRNMGSNHKMKHPTSTKKYIVIFIFIRKYGILEHAIW